MSGDDIECDNAVGYLVLIRKDKPDSFTDIPIEANAQFDIGRKDVADALDLIDPMISNRHLRFHCVLYGDDEADKVAPLVYVRVLSSNPVLLTQVNATGGNSTCHLSKDQPDVLLNHGDTLILTGKVMLEYSALYDNAEPRPALDAIRQVETKQFANEYVVTPRKLGAGGYASVYLAINSKTRRQVACKIVPLPGQPPLPNTAEHQAFQRCVKTAGRTAAEKAAAHRKKLQELRREFEILKDLDHPNIIRLAKAIYSTSHVYIFQELITGGDLLSYLEKKQGLGQPEAAIIIFQLLNAVDYLHDNGVVHRDVKPENILMTSWREGDRVVLTDFGQSRSLKDGTSAANDAAVFRMQSVIGTLGYTAPEVQKQIYKHSHPQQGYSKSIDIWSIGCLTGTLFTNQFLFPRDADNGNYAPPDPGSQAVTAEFNLGFLDTKEEWKGISSKAKSFIRSCVAVDEKERMTAKEALKHDFLSHRKYAADIRAAYGRAVENWKPRKKPSNLIEYIRPTETVITEAGQRLDTRLHAEVKSKHFPAGIPSIPQFRDFASFSETTKQRHTPLSPIETDAEITMSDEKQWSASKKRTRSRIIGASWGNLKARKSLAPEESCFSIQDLAPPVTQPSCSLLDNTRDTPADRWLTEASATSFSHIVSPHQKKARMS